LLLDEPYFGIEMVMEASVDGFHLVPYDVFSAKHDLIIVVSLDPAQSAAVEGAVKRAATWLGQEYDVGGLFGNAFVLIGRWFRRKWKNPLASSKSMFCSEAVVRVLQSAEYPGTSDLDPETTTPQDLMDFLGRMSS
jgi:hypothetical protein